MNKIAFGSCVAYFMLMFLGINWDYVLDQLHHKFPTLLHINNTS